ncbi:hypothetical protein ACLI1C_12010 [Devosia sp. XGJD_8]|uniref:hypothetical protein n=1 Tax=Devosia sp. XGJD_8 TaxID=3391187 RepID=UPI003984C1CA
MAKLGEDLQHNYSQFSKNLPSAIEKNVKAFRGNDKLLDSYARIAAINAMKRDLVEHHLPQGAAHFFYEAHNDALLSHVNASFGSWRPALQSLRSFMENTMSAIFYMDHPVELQKWAEGQYYIAPRDLREYVADHPQLRGLSQELDLKAGLDNEYATLSKAVHASNSLFRMTSEDAKTKFADVDVAELGKWAARERAAVNICMVALTGLMKEHLDGAKQAALRSALSHALLGSSVSALKKHCDVSIPT